MATLKGATGRQIRHCQGNLLSISEMARVGNEGIKKLQSENNKAYSKAKIYMINFVTVSKHKATKHKTLPAPAKATGAPHRT